MSKYELKFRARELRRKGTPINEIKNELGLSKSTISLWCRDIILTEEQYKKIKKEHIFKTQKGRLAGAQMNKNKRLEAIEKANNLGMKVIKNISKRELLLIGTALYWSEGSKSDSTTGFVFVNSDPEMIYLMKMCLINVFKIPNEDIVCSIQINKVHKKRIKIVLNFWKKLLDLQNSQIRKPYYINTAINKVYQNYNNYYGICRLMVRKSTNLKYQMIGLIKGLRENVLPT